MQISYAMTFEEYKLYFCQKKHIRIWWCQAENIIKSRGYNTTLLKLLTPV